MNFYKIIISVTLLVSLSGCLKEKEDSAVAPAPKPQEYNFALLADSLQNSTYSNFLSSNGKYYMQNNGGNAHFHYWWNAHMVDVLVDGFVRTNDSKYKDRILSLVRGIKESNGNTYINDYYDDMEWLALSSLRAYEVTQNQEYLDVASLLWTDIQTGQNTNQGGGIAWRKSQMDYKNTPANAPAIILACRLYRLKKNAADLAIARDLYSWLKTNLVDASGLVWDGKNRLGDGQMDKWVFTYNQGVFIGAALELYKATNEQYYLNDAIKTADYVTNDTQLLPGGIMKDEGGGNVNEGGDGGLFKGILVRYLALMAKEISVPKAKRDKYSGVINFNATTLYQKGIRRPAMIIGSNWTSAGGTTTNLTTQLSGVMLIEANAILKQ